MIYGLQPLLRLLHYFRYVFGIFRSLFGRAVAKKLALKGRDFSRADSKPKGRGFSH